MSLKERITEDMKAAMRAKDAERLGTIRLLTAAMKQKEVDERKQESPLECSPGGLGPCGGPGACPMAGAWCSAPKLRKTPRAETQ